LYNLRDEDSWERGTVRRCVWTFCNKLHAKGRMPRDAPLSMEAYWKQVGSKLEARWQQDGSKMAARWQQMGSRVRYLDTCIY